MTSSTNDVANITDAGKGVDKKKTTADNFRKYMGARAESEGANVAYEIAIGNVAAVMDAAETGTEDDIWDADTMDMVSGQDLIDVELQINSFTVHKAGDEYENPWGIYIVVNSNRLSDGEEIIWNTGAINVIGKLRAFEAREMLPIQAVIKGIPASKGTVLKLARVPKRAVQAS
jgi:hypothetical protein